MSVREKEKARAKGEGRSWRGSFSWQSMRTRRVGWTCAVAFLLSATAFKRFVGLFVICRCSLSAWQCVVLLYILHKS